MKTASIFTFMMTVANCLSGQYSVQLLRPVGVSLSTRDLWNCIVMNSSNQTQQVRLHGIITEAKAGRVFEINSAIFDLQPGTVAFNTANYQSLTPEQVVYTAPLYETYVVRTNSIPRGSYTFCIELVAPTQQTVLATHCIDVSVLTSTPPALIAPMYGDSICEANPFFIWTPPQPPLSGPDVSYELRIYEVQGQQNPVSATLTNPIWYTADNFSTPIAQYGIDGRPFVAGRNYAWYVLAIEGKTEVSRSEIGQFTFKECNQQGNDDPLGQDSVRTATRRLTGVHYFAMPEFESTPNQITNKRNNLYISYLSNIETEVHLAVRDHQGIIVHQEPVRVQSGYNYMELSAQTWRFNRGQYHTLHLTDAFGRKQALPFWHKPD